MLWYDIKISIMHNFSLSSGHLAGANRFTKALFSKSMSSRIVRILNRHGYYLEVLRTGEIKGTRDENSPNGRFEQLIKVMYNVDRLCFEFLTILLFVIYL